MCHISSVLIFFPLYRPEDMAGNVAADHLLRTVEHYSVNASRGYRSDRVENNSSVALLWPLCSNGRYLQNNYLATADG
jgi:hypothetical protein